MASTFYLPDCLTREGRMLLYKRFRVPKLFRFAKNLEWDKICQRCQEHPKVAAKEAAFQHDYAPNETPLHVVLHPFFLLAHDMDQSSQEDQDMDDVVQQRHLAAAALLRANKDAAMKTCCLGTCPLTLVAMDPYGMVEDVNMLVSASPKSALVQDLEGRTPLHYACINNRSNEPMIKALICACPEAAMLKERQGRLALHYACMANVTCAESSSTRSSDTMAHGFAEMLAKETDKAPISTAMVVKLLLDTNETAVSHVDKNGRTPLHYLCRYIQTLQAKQEQQVIMSTDLIDVLCLLVQANSSVALQSDKDDFKPMAVICDLYHESESRIMNIDKSKHGDKGYTNRQQQYMALHRIVNLVNQCQTA